MYKNFTRKGVISLCLFISLFRLPLSAQSITASPQNITRPAPGRTVSVFLNRLNGGWGSSGNYVWTVSPSTGVTIGSYSQSSPAADVTVVFSAAALGSYTFTLTRGTHSASVTVMVGNIAASLSSGSSNSVSALNVLNGSLAGGPGTVFTPVVSSSALGLSADGYYYYLPSNYFGNDGHVTVYAAKPDGSSSTAIGSIDLNGSSNNDLGFVRLAIDPTGTGWILAGDNTTLYLGKFVTSGINPTTITVVDPSVSLVNGSNATFFNGDICFSGNGTLYALANSNGVTQIFTGIPNGSSTVLTKKWDLVNQNGNPFTGAVSGVAFDILGSLYICSTSGLYYINQNTVNTANGTVQCSLVSSISGLTDLASNVYPLLSTLPVRLLSFSGNYSNQKSLLGWETGSEQNLLSFEIQRSFNGNDYQVIGTVPANGNTNSRQQYHYTDDLSSLAGPSFMYRLKMIDADGSFKYSNVIMIRKESSLIKGITLNPNPVINGMATARFSASLPGVITARVIDLSGRIVLQQQNNISAGNNSISINGLDQLKPGTFVLQLSGENESQQVKFTISR